MSIAEERRLPDSISTVLFDLDDTLLDSFSARVKALQKVFTTTGIRRPGAEQFMRNLQGTQLKDALSQLEMTQKTEPGLLEAYRRAYWKKEAGTISLYQGVKPVLDTLHSRSIKLEIVTQKRYKFEIEGRSVGVFLELEKLGITHLFSVTVGFRDVINTKPHPEGINLALKHLGEPPGKTLFVGDSAADIKAAQAARCWSCHATWGIPASEHILDGIQADIVVKTPKELLGFVLQ